MACFLHIPDWGIVNHILTLIHKQCVDANVVALAFMVRHGGRFAVVVDGDSTRVWVLPDAPGAFPHPFFARATGISSQFSSSPSTLLWSFLPVYEFQYRGKHEDDLQRISDGSARQMSGEEAALILRGLLVNAKTNPRVAAVAEFLSVVGIPEIVAEYNGFVSYEFQ